MSISFVGYNANGAENTSLVLTPHASTADGDMMIAILVSDSDDGWATEAGWDQLENASFGGTISTSVYTKIAGASEGPATFDFNGLLDDLVGQLITLTKSGGETWADPTISSLHSIIGVTNTTLVTSSVTVAEANDALICAWCSDGGHAVSAGPSGMTITVNSIYAGTIGVAAHYQLSMSAGAVTKSLTFDTSDQMQAIAVSIGLVAVGGVTVNIPTGSLGLTGFAPIVSVTNNQVIDVPVASLDLAGLAPTINTDVTVSVPAASLGLIGLEPTIDVTENQIVNIPVASLALSGQVPTITTTANISIDIPVASLGLNGLVPTIATTGNIEINVPVADLTLTGQVPTITVTANISIDIPTASLSLVGQVPVIVTDDNIIIDVPVASLSLVGYGPDAVTPVSIDVPVASLALDGKVPTIQTDITVNIPVASLALTGEVPTITATANISIDVPVGDLTLTGFIPTILTPGVVPSVPGLEYTLVANRLHFVIPINRLHHTLKENKLHYTVKEEN